MFRWRKNRSGPELLASKREQEQIEIRFTAASMVLMQAARELGTDSTAGAVHLITAGEASTLKHVELLQLFCGGSSFFSVARLSRDDSDPVRATAYRAHVVVGTPDDFVADWGREYALGIVRYAALVEGEPSNAIRDLLAAYRSVATA